MKRLLLALALVVSFACTTFATAPLALPSLTNTVVAVLPGFTNLSFLQCYNSNAAAAYVQLFNATTGNVTLGTTTPLAIISLAPTASGGYALTSPGINFPVALSAAATTTPTGSTALGAAITCTFGYN